MQVLLKPWNISDDGSDREISGAIYPEYVDEPLHPTWFPARQLGAPRECVSRYIVTIGQQCAGYAALWEVRARRYRFDLAVRPEWQQQSIGSQLLSRIEGDARAFGATGIQARVRDDKLTALDFIRRRGFQESHRMGAYRLDFVDADLTGCQEAFTRLGEEGIDVTNLAAIRQQDSRYPERFYDLFSAAQEGWPDPDPDPAGPIPVSFERVKAWLDAVELPDAFFIARHAQRYIAFSSVFSIATAVHPGYRRKRIATRLKAGSIADAQRRGLRGQTTGTASAGMQIVLQRLGYRRLWSEIRLIKVLE